MGSYEASNYEQLVKALRDKFIAYDVTGNHNSAQLYKDAADEIEALVKINNRFRELLDNRNKDVTELQRNVDELTSQLPKRGEWVGVSPTVDTVQCSVCGGQLFSEELETPYCPYCGAKMNDSNASNASNALNALDNAHDGLIVRCRDCKWYSIYEAKKDGTPDKRYSPSVCLREIYAKRRDPDWFCADGEREVQDGQE